MHGYVAGVGHFDGALDNDLGSGPTRPARYMSRFVKWELAETLVGPRAEAVTESILFLYRAQDGLCCKFQSIDITGAKGGLLTCLVRKVML